VRNESTVVTFWAKHGTYLKQHPGSAAARALDNPLTLSAARDAYAGQDPAALTDTGRFPSVRAVREHLLNQLLVTAFADEHQRAHDERHLDLVLCEYVKHCNGRRPHQSRHQRPPDIDLGQ
jgi:putative transposase